MAKRIPSAPAGFDADTFFSGVLWHQKWQVFKGIYTPGVNLIEEMCDDLQLPRNLAGRRVLDIGAWNGCLSFECERRGAREIVALSPEDPDQSGFNKLREVLGSTRVRYVRGTVYDLNPRQLEYFDTVLFCGVLYHLRYPLLGIDNIRRVCKGEVYIETVVSDAQLIVPEGKQYKIIPMEEVSGHLLTTPLWQFYRFDELNGDPSNWFGPNCAAVIQAFESAGFKTRALKNFGRATFYGKLKKGAPEFLTIGTTEGVYYDEVTSHLLGSDNLNVEAAPAGATWSSFRERVLGDLLTSQEYYQRQGGNDAAWIASLHHRLLGGAATDVEVSLRRVHGEEINYRRAVIDTLLSSTEYRTHLIATFYTDYLDRTPSPGEVAHWLGVLKRGAAPEVVQAEFLSSGEYFDRHGGTNGPWLEQVCRQLLDTDRTAETDTYLAALDGQLASRTQIVAALLDSLAYRERLLESLCGTYLGRSRTPEEAGTWVHQRSAA
jgi:SAM-dependent methyltransferase